MTVEEALKAYDHAEGVVESCDGVEDLDAASDYKTATAGCPADFNTEQREMAASILLRKHMAAIGRC